MGRHWQPIQFNLPTTSVRDLKVHGERSGRGDVRRGLWILDDLSPLRQVNVEVGSASAICSKPATAMRVRWDNHPTRHYPPTCRRARTAGRRHHLLLFEVSSAKEITLEIRDEHARPCGSFRSKQPAPDNTPKNVPDYWFAPPDVLSKNSGRIALFGICNGVAGDSGLQLSRRAPGLHRIHLPDHAIAERRRAISLPAPGGAG